MCPIHPSSPSSWLARSRPKHDDASLSLGPGGRRYLDGRCVVDPAASRYSTRYSTRGLLFFFLSSTYLIPYLGRYFPCSPRSGIRVAARDSRDVPLLPLSSPLLPPPIPDKTPSQTNPLARKEEKEHACLPAPLSPKTHHTTPVPEPGVPSCGSAFRASRPFRYGAQLPGLAVFLGGAHVSRGLTSVSLYVCVVVMRLMGDIGGLG
jgi:hypothetical protein